MRVWNDKNYEIAGVDLEMYYSFPNTSTYNNIIWDKQGKHNCVTEHKTLINL